MNYLKLENHPMFDIIQRLMSETKITPADVAENLMPKSPLDNAEKCLSDLIQALEEVKEAEALKTEKEGAAAPEKAEEDTEFPVKVDGVRLRENGEADKPL